MSIHVQVIITSGTLKITQTYSSLLCIFIQQWVVIAIMEIYFNISMTFTYTIHCSGFDHGFKIKHVQQFLPKNCIHV